MNVLQEILAWSADRPTWQHEALRRLVAHGALSDDDIRGLTEICKGDHGLVEKPEVKLLAKEHVPTGEGTAAAVSLVSIFHHEGVNALAPDQTLKFAPAPGLTIVYGDNGAGKTGYIRILKQACRARSGTDSRKRRIRRCTAQTRREYQIQGRRRDNAPRMGTQRKASREGKR